MIQEKCGSNSDGLRVLCLAAQIVLENGGETYRVEETVRRMAKGFEMDEVNTCAFPTCIFVTDGHNTIIRRITTRSTNLDRLTQANDISRKVAAMEMGLEEAHAALESVRQTPPHPQSLLVPMSGLNAAMFTLIFGGGLGTFFIGFITGSLVQLIAPLFKRLEMSQLFFNLVGGFLTALVAHTVVYFLPYGDANIAIAGGIMPLLSGLLMTNAMRDTMYGDIVSGVTRAAEALLIAAAVALGVYIALKFIALMGGLV